MPATTVPADGQVIKWQREFLRNYLRMSGFMDYMGTGTGNIIQMRSELVESGLELRIPLVPPLKGKGQGLKPLVGAEEKMSQFWYAARPTFRRNAVEIRIDEMHKSVIDLANARRVNLEQWARDDLTIHIVEALHAVGVRASRYSLDEGKQQQVPIWEATTAEGTAWQTANANRIYLPSGALQASLTASLATLDDATAAHTVTAKNLRAMKMLAKSNDILGTGKRGVRPYMIEDGREFYVVFCDSYAFEQISADTEIKDYLTNARSRERGENNNPLYRDGDIVYKGLIIREVPEIPRLADAGASSADVSVVSLCGQQALGVAWAMRPRLTRRSEDDYGAISGVGTMESRDVCKLFFGEPGAVGEQYGVISGFFATGA